MVGDDAIAEAAPPPETPHPYYDTTRKKVMDFLVGFVVVPVVVAVIIGLGTSLIMTMSQSVQSTVVPVVLPLVYILGFGLALFMLIYSFVKKRHFIGIGIVCSVVLPFLVVGGCILIFMGLGSW